MANIRHTLEGIALTELPKGSVFYSHKQDKDLTAMAHYYNVKIKTERLMLVHPESYTVEKITKVTIL